MQDAANRTEPNISTIQAISSSLRSNDQSNTIVDELEMVVKGENDSCIDSKYSINNNIGNKMKSKKFINKNRPIKISNDNNSDDLPSTSSQKSHDNIDDKNHKEPLKCNNNFEQNNDDDDDVADKMTNVTPAKTDNCDVVVVDDMSSDQNQEQGNKKSGHARTHAIVINLDDNSRFSEEVTV